MPKGQNPFRTNLLTVYIELKIQAISTMLLTSFENEMITESFAVSNKFSLIKRRSNNNIASFFILLILTISPSHFAQSSSNSFSFSKIQRTVDLYEGELGGISNFTSYNTEQGLALSSIASSFVDHFGNIWFGTYGAGVTRYDGKSFTTFTSSNGLAGNVILSIYEDKKGNLWFGTNRTGLSKYDGRKFVTYTTADGLANNSILSICEDKLGNIWFGTYGGGVSKFDGKKFFTFNSLNGLAGDDVRAICEDSKGNLWFGTIRKGVSRYDGKKFTSLTTDNGLTNNSVFNIIEDGKGNLWLGTMGGGISCFDGKSFINYSFSNGIESNNIWSSFKDSKGTLWFGTRGSGVIRFDGKKFTNFNSSNGLPNNFIYSIVQDKDNYIWFGTYGSGICRYEGNSVTSFTTNQTLASNIVFSILQDKAGNYWFGTYGGGVSKLNYSQLQNKKGIKFETYNTSNGFIYNDVKSIYQDSKGNIWFGTIGGGVAKLNAGKGNNFSKYTTAQGLANNKVNCIHQDRRGNYWFGTAGGGISKYDGKEFINYSTAQGLVNNIVLCMLEDNKGNLWFGTSSGVSRYDGNSFKSFTSKNGLASNNVFSCMQDMEGNLWFGTDGGGISRYDGKTFTNFTTYDGLSDNTIGQIIQDTNGRIFFGTNSGLTVLLGWNKDKPIFEIFNKRTGFNIKDVNAGQRGILVDKDGIIWIGTGDDKTALVRFNYNEVTKNNTPPRVIIQNIEINEERIGWYNLLDPHMEKDSTTLFQQEYAAFNRTLKPAMRNDLYSHFGNIQFDGISPFYPIPQNLVLPYEHNHITLEFTAIAPSNSSAINYQYLLEGYNKEWSPLTNKTNAVFGNISEGSYTFYLKAQNANGVWSEPVTYSFTVLPPWYRSYWAYSIYFLILLFVVWGVNYINSRRLKIANIRLEKLIEERTSEIAKKNKELEEQTKEIEKQRVVLEEVNASKDKFFSIIAHDLRSPFSGFLNLTEMMAGNSEEFTISEFSNISRSINKSADNLYKLLNNLLEWAMVQQGNLSYELTYQNLFVMVYQSISTLAEQAEQKGISIINQVDENLNVFADEKLVNTIMRNLLSNALKFTPKNGKVTISSRLLDNDMIEIAVKDTGIGMDKEHVNMLFKIDEKVGRSGTDNEPSTGLGLILCKEFVEKLNGKIYLDSNVNEGSTFYFTLQANEPSK